MRKKKTHNSYTREKIFIHEGEVVSNRAAPLNRIYEDIVIFLEKYRAENISRRGNRIAFIGKSNSGEFGSKFLIGIAYGYISVVKKGRTVHIRYELNYKPYFRDGMLIVGIFLSIMVIAVKPTPGVVCGFIVAPAILMTIMYKITSTRFRFYMEDIIKGKFDRDLVPI